MADLVLVLLPHTHKKEKKTKNNNSDGLERVTVADSATLSDLLEAIHKTTGVSPKDATLSFDAALLSLSAMAADDAVVETIDATSSPAAAARPLSSLGISHGTLLHLHYPYERDVEPVAKPEETAFGAKMTMDELISKFVRIERQEAPGGGLTAASFERHAANSFQAYVSGMTNFSVARAGILYGRFEKVDEEEGEGEEGGSGKEAVGGGGDCGDDNAMETEEGGEKSNGAAAAKNSSGDGDDNKEAPSCPPPSVVARVEAIFEPPQECTADGVEVERGGPDEQLADFVAEQLG